MQNFAFILTMPGNNSWNGKWTGDGECYARTATPLDEDSRQRYEKLVGNHSYNFGDGWRANVQVKHITVAERKELEKKSKGFCGYDWMIASLLKDGKINA